MQGALAGTKIRVATDDDLQKIHTWLVEAKDEHGNFLCNWRVILSHHDKREVLVCINSETQQVLGFLAGGLSRSGILQVRANSRMSGIGRILVDRALGDCAAQDRRILVIECAPSTSIPFWKKMGFTMVDDRQAYRLIPLKHDLPADGMPTSISINFYPENRIRNGGAAPIATNSARAVETPDGRVHLAERVFFADCLCAGLNDVVVEIAVGGLVLYADKAKYEEANALGLRACENGYEIDVIDRSAAG